MNNNDNPILIFLTMIVVLAMIVGCSTTQYVPSKHIEVSCTLPPRCPEFLEIHQATAGQDIYDNLKLAKYCQVNLNLYLDCMKEIGK